ncbi:hypothetical protein AAG906_014680 [Vitis piasezkii]
MIGEMLVGPSKALFMDEISTGLDSSTTYHIINSLKQTIHILNGTAVISLLQPAPETYNLFDDIILLSDSQIVYQGPREDVLEFFESIGFKCPARKGVADFLQEVSANLALLSSVTSRKDQAEYWARKDVPYSFVTVKEFAEAFQSFHIGRKVADELASPFDRAKSHPAALTTKKYGIRKKELLDANMSRETEMHKNSTEDGSIYTGALFFTVVMIMFNGMAELAMAIANLPDFYKQRDFLFYPAWAYALSTWVLKIPITFVEVGVWVFITYYVIGFDPNVERLFRQYLLLLLVNQMASGLFRFIAAAGRNMIVASTFGALAVLMLMALGGFILSHDNVKKWWIWGYWSSPLMYAQNAIVVNEFLGKITVLKSRGFFTDAHWYWIGAGALLGFIFVFNFFYTLCLTFEKPQAVITEESDNAKTGGKINGSVDNAKTATTEGEQMVEAIAEANHNKKKGMVLPFQPHSITFDDIRYSVDMPELLKGVSGAFRPGVLTALIGVSGAGKTTLMDVLAGRKTGGYIEGNITISGYPKKQETFARISGYCEQNDIHSPQVTVHESLLYSAWLRLPSDVNSETRKMFIEEVMELVELTPLRMQWLGSCGKSSIIFMDEPTSGLDARAAAIVMRTVRNTVDTGRTVVCTIHQPSIDIFEAFDELLLMKRGGQEIYVGPLGRHSSHLINYFEGIKGVSKIKDGYNPATWMLEVTTGAQEGTLGVDFNEIYKNSDLYRTEPTSPGTKDFYFATQYSQPFFTQFLACLWKQRWSYWRNPPHTAVIFLVTTFIALMTRQQDLLNAMGSMYAAVLFLGVQNLLQRKSSRNVFSPAICLWTAVVYGVIVYAMIGFEWTAAKFFWYLFFMFFTLLYFTFYGMMAVAATPNQNIASIVAQHFIHYGTSFQNSGVVEMVLLDMSSCMDFVWIGYITLLDKNQTVKQFLDDYFGFKHDFLGVVAAVVVGFVVLFLFIFAYAIKAFNFQRR